MRLIRRSVGIDDEVQAGPVNLQVAQQNAGTEKIAQAQNHAQAIDFCVGRFAGIFKAVNDDPVGFGLEMEQAPVEGCDLGPAAGEFFDLTRSGACAPHFQMPRSWQRNRGRRPRIARKTAVMQPRAEHGAGRSGADGCACCGAGAAARALRRRWACRHVRSSAASFLAARAGGRFRCRRRLWSGRGGRLRSKLGIQHFHIALLAQVGEPVVEQYVHLLLQQNLLNARSHLIERRNGFAGCVLRQQRVVVVGLNLLRRDLNALPESLLDEAQNLQAVAEIGLDALRRQPVRGEECLPSRVGGAVLADAGGKLRADLMQAGIDLLLRRLDGLRRLPGESAAR